MPSLITTHPAALRILMTDDLYSFDEATTEAATIQIPEAAVLKPVPEDAPEPVSFSYLGENNKYLLVLVNDTANEFCSKKTLEALTNILTAKKLELKDIALLNLAKHPNAGFKTLKEYFACSKIALFGINPSLAGIPEIASNQITVYENVKVLATYSFEEMQDDIAKKRIFWNEMKSL